MPRRESASDLVEETAQACGRRHLQVSHAATCRNKPGIADVINRFIALRFHVHIDSAATVVLDVFAGSRRCARLVREIFFVPCMLIVPPKVTLAM